MSDTYHYDKKEQHENPKKVNKGFRHECKCKREVKCVNCVSEKPIGK
jgi:hypothetical protein